MATGWLEPPHPQVAGDYWVTRRSSDAAPGYGLGLPDFRARYRWDGEGAWLTGDHYECTQRRDPVRVYLHSANGWRIELEGPFDHEDYGDVCVREGPAPPMSCARNDRMLTDMPDDNFVPGSFGCHEAMHLASVFRDIIEAHLADHPAVKAKPEWTALANTATTALFDLYQAIAAEHMDACPEGWRSVKS